jgi:hypothetical protein
MGKSHKKGGKKTKKKGYTGKTYGGVLRDRIENANRIARSINVLQGGVAPSKKMTRVAATDYPVKQGPDAAALTQRFDRQRTRWTAQLNDDHALKQQMADMDEENEAYMRKMKNKLKLEEHERLLERKRNKFKREIAAKRQDMALTGSVEKLEDSHLATLGVLKNTERTNEVERHKEKFKREITDKTADINHTANIEAAQTNHYMRVRQLKDSEHKHHLEKLATQFDLQRIDRINDFAHANEIQVLQDLNEINLGDIKRKERARELERMRGKNETQVKEKQEDIDHKIALEALGDNYDAELAKMKAEERTRLATHEQTMTDTKIAQQKAEFDYRKQHDEYADRLAKQANEETEWELAAKKKKLERDSRIQRLQSVNARHRNELELALEEEKNNDELVKLQRAQAKELRDLNHQKVMAEEGRKRIEIQKLETHVDSITNLEKQWKEMNDNRAKLQILQCRN